MLRTPVNCLRVPLLAVLLQVPLQLAAVDPASRAGDFDGAGGTRDVDQRRAGHAQRAQVGERPVEFGVSCHIQAVAPAGHRAPEPHSRTRQRGVARQSHPAGVGLRPGGQVVLEALASQAQPEALASQAQPEALASLACREALTLQERREAKATQDGREPSLRPEGSVGGAG
jgi:hypothetical protein